MPTGQTKRVTRKSYLSEMDGGVQVMLRSLGTSRYFSFAKHGGKLKARDRARRWRDRTLRAHGFTVARA